MPYKILVIEIIHGMLVKPPQEIIINCIANSCMKIIIKDVHEI